MFQAVHRFLRPALSTSGQCCDTRGTSEGMSVEGLIFSSLRQPYGVTAGIIPWK
jgi:hypothetical protein